jgi:hypothetical protein
VLALAVVCAATVGAARAPRAAAYAGTSDPSSLPINQPQYAPEVKQMLLDYINSGSTPAAVGTDTATEVSTGMLAGDTAAGAAPLLGPALGTVALGGAAIFIGWKIGTGIYEKLTGEPWGGTQYSGIGQPGWQWTSQTQYPSMGIEIDNSWLFATSVGWGPFGCPSHGPYGECATSGGQGYLDTYTLGLASGAVAHAANPPDPNNPVVVLARSDIFCAPAGSGGPTCAGLEATPSNATEYAGLGTHATSPGFTVPASLTDAQLEAARNRLGTHDTANHGNAAQAATTAIDHHLDPSYDPAGTFTMPSCLGIQPGACTTLLSASGATVTPTYTPGTFTGADVTYPAGSVITQPYPASTSVGKSNALTFQLNPGAADFPTTIPTPLPGETFDAYSARLRSAGFTGTITDHTLSDTDGDPADGPDATIGVRVRLGTDTTTTTLRRVSWPAVAPRARPDVDVEVDVNPPDYAPVPTPGATGSCICPALNLSPLQGLNAAGKFPFGLLGWLAGGITGTSTSSAPAFDMTIVGHTQRVDLASWDPVATTLRALEAFAIGVLVFWGLAHRFMGWGAPSGGD